MYKFLYLFLTFSYLSSFAEPKGLIEYPKDCLSLTVAEEESVCYFGTVTKTSEYTPSELNIFLSKDALLKKEKGALEWIYGSVLLEVEMKTEVQFRKYSITLQQGKYLFFGTSDTLNVEVLDGHFKLDQYIVTEGFHATFFWRDGILQFAPLQAINLSDHLARYISVKSLNKNEAKKYLEVFRAKHKNYLAWATELNENLIKRSQAQTDHETQRRQIAQQKARLAKQKQKEAFFSKVFER